MAQQTGGPDLDQAFVKRTMFQFLVAASLFLAWQLANVLLLAFGAIVLAVLLRAMADPLRDHTPLPDKAALASAVVGIMALIAVATWLFGALLVGQMSDLAGRLPTSLAELRRQVSSWPFGDEISARLTDAKDLTAKFQGLAGRFGSYAISVAGAVTNTVLVGFAGVFLAIDPGPARRGLLALFPSAARATVARGVDASGRALKLWLVGVLVDMLFVGVLTGVGAWALGLPSPVALAAIAAITDFVPYVGPIISIVPGVLVALPEGPHKVLWTLAMYIAIQQVEGNVIYPFIQRRAVDLPPALSLLGVAAFGVLFGPFGVVLATPLLVVIFTMVRVVYVQDTLGEPAAE